MANYVLFESASGYGLFEIKENEEIASVDDEVCAFVSSLRPRLSLIDIIS
jgi:hypothetical protein